MEADNANLLATANVAQGPFAANRGSQPRNSHNCGRGHSNNRGGGRQQSGGRGRGRNSGGYGNNSGHGNNGGYGNGNNQPPVICQMCGLPGHTDPNCRRYVASANVSHSPQNQSSQQSWLVDSGASHNLTNDLGNLSIHSEYDGTDELQIADGSGLPIFHTGSHNRGTSTNRPM